MKSFQKLCFLFATGTFTFIGCGSPASDNQVVEKSNSSSPEVKENSTETTTQSAQTAAPDSGTKAETATIAPPPSAPEKSGPSETIAAKPEDTAPAQPASAQVAPSNANDAIAVVNLLDLPRIKEKSSLQKSTTYLDYVAVSTMSECDAFYKKLFESQGWQELPPLSPPTEHYIDRLFIKSGYYVRVTLNPDQEKGESFVTLANLGNVDLRSLPQLPDAVVGGFPSTPVNFAYQTPSSIPDAADALLKLMEKNGWQRYESFVESPADVPDYREIRFRNEACRLNVGLIKNPQMDKINVSYYAVPLTPFDIPTADVSQAIKINDTSSEAKFAASDSRKELVSVLQANSQKFGWKLGPTEKFEAGEEHMVPINVKSGSYVIARLVESGGKYFGSLENIASPPQPKKLEPEANASIETDAATEKMPAHDASVDKLNAEIESAVEAEISKVLGSLNSPEATKPASGK